MKILEKGERLLARIAEKQFYLGLLSMMAVLTTVLVADLALDMHRNFLTIACDTAAYQNAIVNTLHGSWFRDTSYDGPNILGLHTTFVLLLLAPIYALFPTPDTLFYIQICGVYSTAIPLYLVALELLKKPPTAFLIAGAALASPLLLHMAMSPFHPETWIGAMVLWSYFFYLRNRAIGFWASFGVAVSCGEPAALIYVVLGAALLMIDDGLAWRKRYGIWSLGAGVGWLLFTVVVVLPFMRSPGQTNLFALHYSDWGIQSGLELIMVPARNPIQCLGMLLSLSRWEDVASLVGFPLLIALFSRRSLCLLAVFPVYFIMSDQVFFQPYHAYFFQFAFLAGYIGLIDFLGRQEISSRLGTAVIICTIFINALLFCPALSLYTRFDVGSEEALNTPLHLAFDKIPRDAGVYGPHRFSAYLSNRPNMVMGDLADENLDFKAMLDMRFSVTNVHPEQINYIVCDLINDQCGWRGWRQDNFDPDTTKRRTANIKRFIQSGRWQLCYNQNQVVILRRIEN